MRDPMPTMFTRFAKDSLSQICLRRSGSAHSAQTCVHSGINVYCIFKHVFILVQKLVYIFVMFKFMNCSVTSDACMLDGMSQSDTLSCVALSVECAANVPIRKPSSLLSYGFLDDCMNRVTWPSLAYLCLRQAHRGGDTAARRSALYQMGIHYATGSVASWRPGKDAV